MLGRVLSFCKQEKKNGRCFVSLFVSQAVAGKGDGLVSGISADTDGFLLWVKNSEGVEFNAEYFL